MTDPQSTPTLPDVETLMEQLRDPATILADALSRIHEADTLMGDYDDMEPSDLAMYRLGTAFVLTRVAKAAAELAEIEQRHTLQVSDGDDADMDLRTAPADDLTRVYEPKAVNGVRFTADLRGHYVGVVAGREWLHVPGHGFVDIGYADEHTDGAHVMHRLSGRVVSGTPDHVLCITDGGTSVTLPRALIVESADE